MVMAKRRPPDDSGRDDGPDSPHNEMPGWSSSHGSLSDNLVFAAVDNPRRRFILEALQEEGGEADIDELVEDVATIEQEVDELDEDCDHEEILEDIYDSELPELTDIGVVDLHENEGTVELGPYAEELDIDDFTPDLELGTDANENRSR